MSDLDAAEQAMLEFIGTFPTVSTPPTALAELSDGVAIFEAFSEIDGELFDPSTIARHLGDNWVLKSSNLRKLLRSIEQYFRQVLNKDDERFADADATAWARNNDSSVCGRQLTEWLAAAAVSCGDKGRYVGRILEMTAPAQAALKEIIESGMAHLVETEATEYDAQDDEGDGELVFDDDDDKDDDSDGGIFGNHEQSSLLSEELMQAQQRISTLESQIAVSEEESAKATDKLRALVHDLQDRLTTRQDDMTALEEEHRTATAALTEAESKVTELTQSQRQMADDLDVAKAKTAQLHKAEATVLAYKKKLDSVGVMNQQMTDLEDQAATYLQQIMDLEQQVKKSAALQKTVAQLQERNAILEQHSSDTANSSVNTASEIVDLKSKLQAADAAKRMFEQELQELRAQQEVAADEPDTKNLEISAAPSLEQKEKVMRLEFENKQLKEEVEKLQSAAAAAPVASVEKPIDTSAADLAALQEQLDLKTKENAKISSEKDKLEAYTKRTLAKFQDKYLVALQECMAKLKEKQDKIEALEQRSASERTAQKREERLMSSTIYELGLAIMQNKLKSSAAAGSG